MKNPGFIAQDGPEVICARSAIGLRRDEDGSRVAPTYLNQECALPVAKAGGAFRIDSEGPLAASEEFCRVGEAGGIVIDRWGSFGWASNFFQAHST